MLTGDNLATHVLRNAQRWGPVQMRQIGFSEFSFGYALTEAFVRANAYGLVGFPIFPSLGDEATLGFDVAIYGRGAQRRFIPLFLQFKRSEPMLRRSAKEISKHRLGIRPLFYRMHIGETASDQHAILIRLTQRRHHVYYAAPRFHESSAFRATYRNKQMIRRTAYFSPTAIGPLSRSTAHHVAFEPTATSGWVLSEPKGVEPILSGDTLAEQLLKKLDEGTRLQKLATVLAGDFAEIVPSFPRGLRRWQQQLRAVAESAWFELDSLFLLIAAEKVQNGAGVRRTT